MPVINEVVTNERSPTRRDKLCCLGRQPRQQNESRLTNFTSKPTCGVRERTEPFTIVAWQECTRRRLVRYTYSSGQREATDPPHRGDACREAGCRNANTNLPVLATNQDSKGNPISPGPLIYEPVELGKELASTEAKYPAIGGGRRSSLGKSLAQPRGKSENLERADQGRQGQSCPHIFRYSRRRIGVQSRPSRDKRRLGGGFHDLPYRR